MVDDSIPPQDHMSKCPWARWWNLNCLWCITQHTSVTFTKYLKAWNKSVCTFQLYWSTQDNVPYYSFHTRTFLCLTAFYLTFTHSCSIWLIEMIPSDYLLSYSHLCVCEWVNVSCSRKQLNKKIYMHIYKESWVEIYIMFLWQQRW